MYTKFLAICAILLVVCSLAATTPLTKGSLVLQDSPASSSARNITTYPWTENFAEVPSLPTGWNSYNMDGAWQNWQAVEAFSHLDDASGCVTHTSTSENNEDGWLITPALDLPANPGIALTFWSYNLYPAQYGANQVLVSSGSSDPADGDYVSIWMPFTVSSGWYQNYVDLTPWYGQTVHIAFRYQGLDAHDWNLDEVRVAEFTGIHELPYVENFESGVFPPYYWGQFDEDGQGTYWNWNTGEDHTEEGSCFAVHYTGHLPNPEDDWLATPRIFLPVGSAYCLSFWSLNYYSDLYNENGVYVSTGSVEPSDGQLTQIWSPLTVEETWVKSYIDLSPWAGQSVHIAFRFQGEQYFSQEWRLDDVRVEEYSGISEFPYTETFESGVFPPYYWAAYDADGSGTYWSWNQMENHTAGGICSAMHIWDNEEPSEDGWLVSPQLLLPPEAEFQLNFWSKNFNPDWYGYNGVWVSTGSPDPADGDYVEVWHPDVVTGDWTPNAVDLTSYAGQSIFVAFRYQGLDAHDWYLDDIRFGSGDIDLIPPVITHLPLLCTVRDDIPYGVYCEVADDPTWNSGITGVWLYYKVNEGEWILLTMAPQDAGYFAQIPAQTLGSQITYVIVASDASPQQNIIYSQGYQFLVDDPVWMYYDSLVETSWAGVTVGDWGLGILYENPLWGEMEPLKINGISGSFHLDDTVQLQVWSASDEFLSDLTPLTEPLELSIMAEQWIETHFTELSVSARYFYITYTGINTSNYFPCDPSRYYPNRSYLIWDNQNVELGALEFPVVWVLRVNVATDEVFLAPVLTIINSEFGPELHWTEVLGANYYRVYSALDPSAAEPWDVYDTTMDLSLGDIAQDQQRYFKVTAVQDRARVSGSTEAVSSAQPAPFSNRGGVRRKLHLNPLN